MAKNTAVCIHVLPSLDHLEIIQLDLKHQNNVEKSSSLPGTFDQNTRLIPDIDQLGQNIKDLYDAARIPINTPTVLVLPSFFTRETEMSSETGKEELRLNLTAEAERFYIFKKNEPQVDWVKLNDNKILYTAFPKSEIDKYVEIFQANRIPLLAIELNYFSILRGLVASGAINDEISRRQNWCMLVIADYTFFSAICEGGKIQKTIEAPLSIGMSDELTAIAEIKQDFERFIDQQALSKLIVINNSERIATDVLVGRLAIQEQVLVIEQNSKTLRSRGELNAAYPCSLEAIGGALYNKFPELPSANLMPEVTVDLVAIMDMQQLFTKGLVALNVVALLLCAAMWGLFSFFVMTKEGEVKSVTEKIANLETGQTSEEVLKKRFIKRELDQNQAINNVMVKIGTLIPNELWLEGFTLGLNPSLKKIGLELQGGALSPEMVEQYNNELRGASKLEDLDVTSVELSHGEDGQSHYSWMIKTKNTPPEEKKK